MWMRDTDDPLGKLLFEKYGMHVLRRPRENLAVFQVFEVRDGEAARSGSLENLFGIAFPAPAVAKGESMLDIAEKMSGAISGKIGLDFLQGFLALVGLGPANKASVALEQGNTRALRFRFGRSTRDHVEDDFALERILRACKFERDQSAMKDGYRYYLATAVHHCTQLTFEALDENKAKIDLGAAIVGMGGAEAGLALNGNGQLTASSDKLLAYGVELNEVVHDAKRNRLQLQEARNYVQVRRGGEQGLPRAMVGGAADTMLLSLAD